MHDCSRMIARVTPGHARGHDALAEGPNSSVPRGATKAPRALCWTPASLCVAFLAALLGAVLPAAPAGAAGGAPAGYSLAWSDEFDQLSVAAPWNGALWSTWFGKWNVRHLEGNGDQGRKMHDGEVLASGESVRSYLARHDWNPGRPGYLHEVSGGTLKLRAYDVPSEDRSYFDGFEYVAGMISSETSFSQSYGYWEARLRFNRLGAGQHFALWLLPESGKWPPEIDMLEVVNEPTLAHSNAHGDRPDVTISAVRVSNDWHVYGLRWNPRRIVWTIDGRIVRTQRNYIYEPMYILGSWEIGSRWPGPTNASTPWPAEVEFDYVRVYARPRR